MEAFLIISTVVVVIFTYILAGQVAVRTYRKRWELDRYSELPIFLGLFGYLSLMIVWAKIMAESDYRWLTHPRQTRAERKAAAALKNAEELRKYALETEAIMLMIDQPGETLENLFEEAFRIGKDSYYESSRHINRRKRELLAPVREIDKRMK